MNPEIKKDLQNYGALIVILTALMYGMFKCTRYVDKIAKQEETRMSMKGKVSK